MTIEEKREMEEYRNLHTERWERSSRTWLILSIFVTGFFLLVGQAITNRILLGRTAFSYLMIMAMALIVFSFFIQSSTIECNNSALVRIIEIEKNWNFNGPEARHKKEQSNFWFKIRQDGWYFVFLFLGITYYLAMFAFMP